MSKIFGRHPRRRALELARGGGSKEEVLARTGHVLGLADVSLEVDEGEIFVVMGLSGSSRLTLIRCMSRLVESTAGRTLVDGEDVVAGRAERLQELRRMKLGMVFQHFALFPQARGRQRGLRAGAGGRLSSLRRPPALAIPQWQVPVPESIGRPPSSGTMRHS